MLRPETLRGANDAISNATAKLSAFELFNIRDEVHSSSDGQRMETKIDTFNARYSPKYFGLDKGVSACTVVANHVPINARIIGTHEHGAVLCGKDGGICGCPVCRCRLGYSCPARLDRRRSGAVGGGSELLVLGPRV